MGTKDKKNILIVALLVAVVFMSVGYALLSAQLEVAGTSNIPDNGWDVKITDIRVLSTSGTADGGTPRVVTNSSAHFSATLNAPGDSVTYQVTVTNNGSLDAALREYVVDPVNYNEGDYIVYEITGLSNSMSINAQEVMSFQVTAKYNENAETLPETEAEKTRDLSINLDFIQKR